MTKIALFLDIMEIRTIIKCTVSSADYLNFWDLFSFMDSSSSTSWKRSHIWTGTTPNKPSEKRPKNVSRRIRKPLDFSEENVDNSDQNIQPADMRSPFLSPRHKVCIITILLLFCVFEKSTKSIFS